MPLPLLSATELTCERDDRVLFDQLSFDLNAGELIRVTGANGAGKSTLLRILIDLGAYHRGQVSFPEFMHLEPGLSNRDIIQSNILYIGHESGVKPVLTPEENLRWLLAGKSSPDRQLIWSTLAELGLNGYQDVQCSHLSAGQHRRVALARLALDPAKIWVLDEPFTALDVAGVSFLEKMFIDHCERGGAVVLTTHQPLSIGHFELNLKGGKTEVMPG